MPQLLVSRIKNQGGSFCCKPDPDCCMQIDSEYWLLSSPSALRPNRRACAKEIYHRLCYSAKFSVIALTFSGVIAYNSCRCSRGYSSVGRALEWHSRGQGFESPYLHSEGIRKSAHKAVFLLSSSEHRSLCFTQILLTVFFRQNQCRSQNRMRLFGTVKFRVVKTV